MARVRVCEGCEGRRGSVSLSCPLLTREERGREREPRLAPSEGGSLVIMKEGRSVEKLGREERREYSAGGREENREEVEGEEWPLLRECRARRKLVSRKECGGRRGGGF